MWWLYFDNGAGGHDTHIESSDPGRLARLAYTYLHLPIVAGIILRGFRRTGAPTSTRWAIPM